VTIVRAVNSTGANWANAYYNASSHVFGIGANPQTSQAMTLDASGNLGVGIGTTAGTRVSVRTAATTDKALSCDNSSNAGFVVKFASALTSIGQDFNAPLAFLTNDTERARITSGGDFQIGGTNGTYQLNITQSAGDMIRLFRDASNTVEMFTTSSSTNIFYITVDNSQGVSLTSGNTSWGSYSDARLKNVTGTYTDALADVAKLEAVKFTWKSDEAEKPHVGLLAQSVVEVIPEAVDTDEQGMMSVRYTEVIPLLVAAVQELTAKNAALEARLEALEA
jgi:hypothetical protein